MSNPLKSFEPGIRTAITGTSVGGLVGLVGGLWLGRELFPQPEGVVMYLQFAASGALGALAGAYGGILVPQLRDYYRAARENRTTGDTQ